METVSDLKQFRNMLNQRIGRPLVIVERYGWREMGHTGDIYVPGNLLKISAKEIVVDRGGIPSYLDIPPATELKFPGGTRMEHWGKGRQGPAVLIAYEWPEAIDEPRAAQAAAAFEITNAAYVERVAAQRRQREEQVQQTTQKAAQERAAGEKIAAAWMDHHVPGLVKRAALSPKTEDTVYLLHEGARDGNTHNVFIVCGPDQRLHLVDAVRGNQERDGKKIWQVTEWALNPQSLHFRSQDVPGLDRKLKNPATTWPHIFDIERTAEGMPEIYGNLPASFNARPSRQLEAHKVLDIRVKREATKGHSRSVTITHQSAYMAGPATATFRPSPELRGKSADHMLAVIEAARRAGALEFRGGHLLVNKDLKVENMNVKAGAVPLVPAAAGTQAI